MFTFHKKTQRSVEEDPNAAMTETPLAEELNRRESVLNARIAAFEAAMRQQAEDEGRLVRGCGDANVVDAKLQLEQTADELSKVADALEAREKKMAELAANLKSRENALSEKSRNVEALEAQLAKKRTEAQQIGLRLLAAQEEIDEKERLFEERSQKTLETIKLQKDELNELRKAA